MLQQSAQASRLPIGERRVSRHQKMITIGHPITTGARSLHQFAEPWRAAERQGRAQLAPLNGLSMALPIGGGAALLSGRPRFQVTPGLGENNR